MQQGNAFRISAIVGFVAVTTGAFGAHGLKSVLNEHGTMEVWKTAVLYHLVHAVVLFVLGLNTPWRRGPWWCFLAGVILFSGSLYLLALGGPRWLGPITPLGGACFLAGWAWLAVQGWPRTSPSTLPPPG